MLYTSMSASNAASPQSILLQSCPRRALYSAKMNC
uniref:Uncharacterized protein n=1 Tax=Arundo donax TaxID=35708 RepID=A0A0A9HMB1_ARUDO